MSNNGAPDSWETQADNVTGEPSSSDPDDLSAKFSTLNVNALEFVPSFSVPSTDNDNMDSPTTSQQSDTQSTNSSESPVMNG